MLKKMCPLTARHQSPVFNQSKGRDKTAMSLAALLTGLSVNAVDSDCAMS